VHVLISAAGSGGWSYGGSILTFVLPELLFIFIAGALWVAYTMPHPVPGYRHQPVRPDVATPGDTDGHGRHAAAGAQGSGPAGTTTAAAGSGPAGSGLPGAGPASGTTAQAGPPAGDE
jgi:hypothetical protein